MVICQRMYTVPLFVAAKGTSAKWPKRKLMDVGRADYITVHPHHGMLCDQQKEWSTVLPDDLEGFPDFDFLHDGFHTFTNTLIEIIYNDWKIFWSPLGFKQIHILLIPTFSLSIWNMIAHVFVRHTVYSAYMQCPVYMRSYRTWALWLFRVKSSCLEWMSWTTGRMHVITHRVEWQLIS